MSEIGVGVVGVGFMGRVHVTAYQAAARDGYPVRLVAVCDPVAERREGRVAVTGNIEAGAGSERWFDPAEVTGYAGVDDLLADERVELVSLCTRTDTHVDLACRALAAGKHVLVEKPVATTAEAIQPLREAAAATDRLVMPAMCMRFWPGWTWLEARVRDGSLGRVKSAAFQRLASPPAWSRDFYGDTEKSGGALVDLHIHDADFIRWLFGDPEAVVSTGSLHHVTTIYRFGEDGPRHVVAEGGWDHAPGFEFRMRYVVVFEEATADFDLTRQPALKLARNGTVEEIPLAPHAGYDGEIRHLLDVLSAPGDRPRVTLDDAQGVAFLLDAERISLEQGTEVLLMP